MSVKLDDLVQIYTPELLRNYAALKHSVLAYSPTGLIGSSVSKLKNGVVEGVRMFEMDYGMAVQFGESSPTFVPTKTSNPNEYLKSLVQLIALHGGASNVPHAFAQYLEKKSYKVTKRPWGNHDYVIETAAVANLAGKQFHKDRGYVKKVLNKVDYVLLGQDDHQRVRDFEQEWRDDFKRRNPTIGIGRINYLANALEYWDLIPSCYRPVFLGAVDKESGRLLAVTNGVMVSSDTWGNVYGYIKTGELSSGALVTFHMLAKHYLDIPFENDGDAGCQTTGLVAFKEHFLTPPVMDKQLHFFIVK